MTALVTIGITVYNAQETIGRAINSALRQTWPRCEIIVVDDASNDETPRVIQEIAQTDARIRFLQNPENSGVAMSRNLMIAEAKGEFLVFFDDDDESDPARVERQLARIEAYERSFARGAPVICHCARRQVYPSGTHRLEGTMGQDEQEPAPFGEMVAKRILFGEKAKGTYGSLATCSQMARLSVYRQMGGFNPAFRRSEDTEFNVRLARAGGHFVGIAQPLVTQTMTLSSEKKLEEERLYFLKLLAAHRDFIERHYPYAACLQWTGARYDFLMGRRTDFMRKMAMLLVRHPVFCLRRIVWALPNIGFNMAAAAFHRGAS